jgi:hypothetical protein
MANEHNLIPAKKGEGKKPERQTERHTQPQHYRKGVVGGAAVR